MRWLHSNYKGIITGLMFICLISLISWIIYRLVINDVISEKVLDAGWLSYLGTVIGGIAVIVGVVFSSFLQEDSTRRKIRPSMLAYTIHLDETEQAEAEQKGKLYGEWNAYFGYCEDFGDDELFPKYKTQIKIELINAGVGDAKRILLKRITFAGKDNDRVYPIIYNDSPITLVPDESCYVMINLLGLQKCIRTLDLIKGRRKGEVLTDELNGKLEFDVICFDVLGNRYSVRYSIDLNIDTVVEVLSSKKYQQMSSLLIKEPVQISGY